MDNCKDKYALVCKDRFDKHDEKLDAILDILRGKNDNPGVIDDVRDLKKWRSQREGTKKERIALIVAVGLLFVGNLIRWAFALFGP